MFWNESQHFLGSCFPSFSSILIHLIIFCFNIEDFSRCFACLYEAVSDRLSCYLTNLLWYCQEQLLEICCSSETCLLSRTDTHACTHTHKRWRVCVHGSHLHSYIYTLHVLGPRGDTQLFRCAK